MTNNITKIYQHPSLILNKDIQDICSPLKLLNINYFGHVLIDKNNQFSAIGTSSGFTEHYLKNKYYNVDLHMAQKKKLGQFVVWDTIERRGKTAQMHQEAAAFGVKHTFTIIEEDANGCNYYHFANAGDSLIINQVYLANYDLLKMFIKHFKEQINQSKELALAHQLKFKVAKKAEGYSTHSDISILNQVHRDQFLEKIPLSENDSILNSSNTNKLILTNKDIGNSIKLSVQQSKCIQLLVAGNSNKQIAEILGLSVRTVENYLNRTRDMLGCSSSKELITMYYSNKFK